MSTLMGATIPALTSSQISAAEYYQRRGHTLTEIARLLRVPREVVVQALYYDIAGVLRVERAS